MTETRDTYAVERNHPAVTTEYERSVARYGTDRRSGAGANHGWFASIPPLAIVAVGVAAAWALWSRRPARQNADVTEILTTDHREMLDLIREAQTTLNPERRRDLADTVIAEIMRHAVAEEMYVYPALQKHVAGGDADVQHDKREHQEIVEVMKQIEGCDAQSPEFSHLLQKLQGQIEHHAHDEEDKQFPKLRSAVPAATLMELGGKVEMAKMLAPTRPHPGAPHSELFHKTVGPGVGMVDRLMDKLTGRNTHASA